MQDPRTPAIHPVSPVRAQDTVHVESGDVPRHVRAHPSCHVSVCYETRDGLLRARVTVPVQEARRARQVRGNPGRIVSVSVSETKLGMNTSLIVAAATNTHDFHAVTA